MLAEEPVVIAESHRTAILDAEARHLAHTLASYGVLTRHQLARLSGADHWVEGRFSDALELAEKRGLVRQLGSDFYAAPTTVGGNRDPRRKHRLPLHWPMRSSGVPAA